MRYTDDELLSILKDFYARHGRSPTTSDIAISSTIKRRLGGWNRALELAGLPTNKSHKTWTAEEIKEAIDKFYDKNKRLPLATELDSTPGLPTVGTIFRLSGLRYSEYLESIGYEPNITLMDKKYETMSNHDLLHEFRRELDRIGTNEWRVFGEKRKKGFPHVTYLRDRFDKSWNELLEIIGVEPNNAGMSKEELIDAFKKMIEELGRVPTWTELYTSHRSAFGALLKYYGNYTTMCRDLGYEPPHTKTEVTETDDELIEQYIMFSENLGYPATSRDLDTAEDMYNSDVYMVRFGGLNELRKICGYEYVEKRKQYSRDELLVKLTRLYKENGGRLTYKELSEHVPTNTVLRHFKTTRLSTVWEEIENNMKGFDKNDQN